jgi:hypothetical protein
LQGSNRVDLKPDRQRRDLHQSNLPVTSRKIGPSTISWFISWYQISRFPARYNLVCLRFIFVHYLQSTKKSPKIFQFPLSYHPLCFAISFSDCFVEFVSVVESSCWFRIVFVVVVQSPVAVFCVFRRCPIHRSPTTSRSHHNTRLALASRLV